MLTEILGLRPKLGSAPFQPGAPLDAELQQYGGTYGMAAGQTPGEAKEEQTLQHQKVMEKNASPETKLALHGAELEQNLESAGSPTAMNLFGRKAGIMAGAGAAARLSEASSPEALGLDLTKLNMSADVKAEHDVAKDIRKKQELANTPVSELAGNKTTGGVYVHKGTLKLATGAPGEPKTKAEADANGDYKFVSNKKVDGPG